MNFLGMACFCFAEEDLILDEVCKGIEGLPWKSVACKKSWTFDSKRCIKAKIKQEM
jgi:hypothetical protein